MTTSNDLAKEIHADETRRGAERAVKEVLLNAVPNTPEYQAVIDAAQLTDTDVDGLYARALRIAVETGDLAREAVRVRDQHALMIDGLNKEIAGLRASATTLAALEDNEEVTAPMRRHAPIAHVHVEPIIPPPTLVHWVRRQVAIHVSCKDTHPILSEPGVYLGDLRAWLKQLDDAAPTP